MSNDLIILQLNHPFDLPSRHVLLHAEKQPVIPAVSRPRRRARKAICCSDSSPLTYNIVASTENATQACNNNVDLPIPGSPPSNVTEPVTSPPPSTRSSSPRPVVLRVATSPLTASSRSTCRLPAQFFPSTTRPTGDLAGCNEFHSPQAGHLPSHLLLWLPQLWQKYVDFVFDKMDLFLDCKDSLILMF